MNKIRFSDAEIRLKDILLSYPSLAVAVSGGGDSTLLAKVASEIIPDNKLILVHAVLPFFFICESEFIKKWASENGLNLHILELDLLQDDNVIRNDSRRCYYCKYQIMAALLTEVKKYDISVIADGTVTDDFCDYRPGLDATAELKIQHPLADAGFDKRLTRLLARKLSLPNWNMPASACLASRIPCGTPITLETLNKIGEAEDYLSDLGFLGNRVRAIESDIARVEVNPIHLKRLLRMHKDILSELKKIGFKKVIIDSNGYSRGSMNRTI